MHGQWSTVLDVYLWWESTDPLIWILARGCRNTQQHSLCSLCQSHCSLLIWTAARGLANRQKFQSWQLTFLVGLDLMALTKWHHREIYWSCHCKDSQKWVFLTYSNRLCKVPTYKGLTPLAMTLTISACPLVDISWYSSLTQSLSLKSWNRAK